jgi:acyl carrier protein
VSQIEAEVMDAIRSILSEQLEVRRPVAPGDRLADCYELDSVGLITLAVGLEDLFRVQLSEADAPRLETFGDLARLVAHRVAGSGT